MAPEWEPHKATWMGFPTGAYDTAGVSDDDVFDAWGVGSDAKPDSTLRKP